MTTRIVFWHDYLMFHQAPYIRALAERPDTTVHWAVSERLPETFRQRGYPLPDVGRVEVVVDPDADEIDRLLKLGDGAVHVFFGLRGMPLAKKAFMRSKHHAVRRVLMSENRYEPGLALWPRRLVYTCDAIVNRRWLDGLLCIGYTGRYGGRSFFSRCGYAADRMFPFLHLVEPARLPVRDGASARVADAPYRLLYVGQLIRRKRVDLLLEALAGLDDLHWQLSIVGSGELRQALEAHAVRLGIRSKIDFVSTVDNAGVFEHMSRSDALVLPSRFDGWGAVVSEALTSGLPVVCSDRCGASDLLRARPNGDVFRADSATDLRRGIHRTLTSPDIVKGEVLRRWASRITGASAAAYFMDVVHHLQAPTATPRPACPWLEA